MPTAWHLGGLETYEDLNLRRWAHMLGFRGHFLTKSRPYSTTFRAIRGDRRAFRLAETLDRLDLDPEEVVVVNDWAFTGTGQHTAASLTIASGADVKIVQQMLGHKTATMTLDLYGHLFPDRLNDIADRMDQIVCAPDVPRE